MSQSPLPLCQKCPFVSPLACQKCTNKVLYYVFFVPIKTPDLLVLNGFLALSGCFLSFNAFFPYFLRNFSLHPIFLWYIFSDFPPDNGEKTTVYVKKVPEVCRKSPYNMSKMYSYHVGKVPATCRKRPIYMSEMSLMHVANVPITCQKRPFQRWLGIKKIPSNRHFFMTSTPP